MIAITLQTAVGFEGDAMPAPSQGIEGAIQNFDDKWYAINIKVGSDL